MRGSRSWGPLQQLLWASWDALDGLTRCKEKVIVVAGLQGDRLSNRSTTLNLVADPTGEPASESTAPRRGGRSLRPKRRRAHPTGSLASEATAPQRGGRSLRPKRWRAHPTGSLAKPLQRGEVAVLCGVSAVNSSPRAAVRVKSLQSGEVAVLSWRSLRRKCRHSHSTGDF